MKFQCGCCDVETGTGRPAPVMIDGTAYKSMIEASEALRMYPTTLQYRLRHRLCLRERPKPTRRVRVDRRPVRTQRALCRQFLALRW